MKSILEAWDEFDNVDKQKKTTEDKLTEVAGGKALGLSVEDIAKKHGVKPEDIEAQIKKGIKVEQEHSSDPEAARKVAMDHLVEFPDYYDKLAKMEKDAKLKEDTVLTSNKLESHWLNKAGVAINDFITMTNNGPKDFYDGYWTRNGFKYTVWLRDGHPEGIIADAEFQNWKFDDYPDDVAYNGVKFDTTDDGSIFFSAAKSMSPDDVLKALEYISSKSTYLQAAVGKEAKDDIDDWWPEPMDEGYGPELLKILHDKYVDRYTPERHEMIWDKIYNDYGDEDLANDVLGDLEDEYKHQGAYSKEWSLTEVFVEPKDGEAEQEYVSRFVASDLAKKEFPDMKQRLAVAYSKFKGKKESAELAEDTVRAKDHKWVNKGDSGETHGEFKTKKAADEQRKAMFVYGFKK